jgi:hypothetical protein
MMALRHLSSQKLQVLILQHTRQLSSLYQPWQCKLTLAVYSSLALAMLTRAVSQPSCSSPFLNGAVCITWVGVVVSGTVLEIWRCWAVCFPIACPTTSLSMIPAGGWSGDVLAAMHGRNPNN